MEDFFEEFREDRKHGILVAVVLVVSTEGTTPRESGAKMLVYPDGRTSGTIGGGQMERNVVADAVEALKSGQRFSRDYAVLQPDGSAVGSMRVYVESIVPIPNLILCGLGHVAEALILPAYSIGFHIIAIDTREKDKAVCEHGCCLEKHIHASSFAEGLKEIPENEYNYFIACCGYEQDEETLYYALQKKSSYVGMLAGAPKRKLIFEHLRARGISEEALARVHSPIGLDLGAETPEEIAIAITAEILKVRKDREKKGKA